MLAEAFTRIVTVTNPHGLHARPANVIVKTVRKYDAQVAIQNGSQIVDATSIFDLMSLGATQGTELLLSAKGRQAQEVLDALPSNFTPSSRLTTRTSGSVKKLLSFVGTILRRSSAVRWPQLQSPLAPFQRNAR